jgi:hypothetical protein
MQEPGVGYDVTGMNVALVPRSGGPGIYASVPLQGDPQNVSLGLRLASQGWSAGMEGCVLKGEFNKIWLLRRAYLSKDRGRQLLLGMQLAPSSLVPAVRNAMTRSHNNGSEWPRLTDLGKSARLCMLCEYQAGSPGSYVSASVALDDMSTVQLSVYQHLARVRRIYNLFEDDDVCGVTNYIDFGMTMKAPVGPGESAESTIFEAGCQWQVCCLVLTFPPANRIEYK